MTKAAFDQIAEGLREAQDVVTRLRIEADTFENQGTQNEFVMREAADEIDRLRGELSAAIGYMINAKFDLDIGAPKRTAKATIEGGIKRARAALGYEAKV